MNAPAWLNPMKPLFAAVTSEGGELRAVGGAVRDHVMGRNVGEIDAATTLAPETVMALAQAQGWKAVPTGIEHGTVTIVLPGKLPVEVTTLRRDVTTDGRRATVEYTDDWQEDAARRDFTINALFMDADGMIHDYFGGQADIAAKHLRFIGDAGTRIAEDGLRILRYFRFLAQLGWKAEDTAVKACAQKREMIGQLSGERIQQEMKRLLIAKDPSDAVAQMIAAGLPKLLSNAEWQAERLKTLLGLERTHGARGNGWARLMSVIAPSERRDAALWIADRWKLSRVERRVLLEVSAGSAGISKAAVKEWVRTGDRGLVSSRVLLAALDEPQIAVIEMMEIATQWKVPVFPVTAKDLLATGMSQGPELGAKLKEMEQRWVTSDYRIKKDALLKG